MVLCNNKNKPSQATAAPLTKAADRGGQQGGRRGLAALSGCCCPLGLLTRQPLALPASEQEGEARSLGCSAKHWA